MKNSYTLLVLISILISGLINSALAQCPYDNTAYLQGPAPTTVGTSIFAPQTWGGDFNRVTNMVAGSTYEISTCSTPTFDSEITIYPAGGGTSVGYDDDGCGFVSGPSKILFTPTVSGDYDFLLDEFPCGSNNTDMTVEFKLISTGGGGGGASLTIPVVVHVVYKNATENVSDTQIQSQLQALNLDYRKLNADFANVPSVFQPAGADFDIDFCLASFDPSGNPTSGITRTPTTVNSFDINTPPKFTSSGGHDNWDPTRYLNLWVCDLTGSLLGYATFPADLATSPQLDGVVIDYLYFGTTGTATPPFNLGRTATHEIGHWLNLRHIWGDAFCGDDFVNDTPTQETSNGGCPAFPHVTCSNGPNGDMFMNYMDYVDDGCMFLFTNGQKLRTDATLALTRNLLATSAGCGPTAINETSGGQLNFSIYPNPASNAVTFSVPEAVNKNAEFVICNMVGNEIKRLKIFNATAGRINLDLSNLSKGVYIVRLISPDGSSTQKLVLQ